MLIETQEAGPRAQRHQYHVGLARSTSEIREAQKLRYRVFAEEMGACLATAEPGMDANRFDPYCEHLIVRDETRCRIVGTYRILTPEGARRAGAWVCGEPAWDPNFNTADFLVLLPMDRINPRYMKQFVKA